MSVCALNEPKIVKSPEDVVIVTGEDVTLPCVVDNLPLGDNFVQWTKDGFAFGYDRDMPGNFRMASEADSVSHYRLAFFSV